MPIGQISSRGIRGRVGTGKKGVCLTCFTSGETKRKQKMKRQGGHHDPLQDASRSNDDIECDL